MSVVCMLTVGAWARMSDWCERGEEENKMLMWLVPLKQKTNVIEQMNE